MSGNPQPYDWSEAKLAMERGAGSQLAGEQAIKDAFKAFGLARKTYQMAFAEEILRQRSEHPATIALDLARGTERVAQLRYEKDVAEGVMEAAKSAVWRHTADRKDLGRLVDWSRRVAPDGQDQEPVPIGAAA